MTAAMPPRNQTVPARPRTARGLPGLSFVAAGLVAAAAFAPAPAIAEAWALLGREGGCYPIQTLKRRVTDLPEVKDPESFERFVRVQGWRYTRRPVAGGPGRAEEFVVESQGLSLVFVTAGFCGNSSAPGR